MDDSTYPPPGVDPPPAAIWSPQQIAKIAVVVVLVAFGVFILWDFVTALLWAVIFAIATWPLYRRFARWSAARLPAILPPLLFTLAIGLVFIAPLAIATVEVGREAHVLVRLIAEAEKSGLEMPDWLPNLPGIGGWIAGWWQANLGNPEAATELLGRINRGMLSEWPRNFGIKLLRGIASFGFTLLALFFIYLNGIALTRRLLLLGDRLLGQHSEQLGLTAIAAVHGTVNGLVLVGLGEGIILGLAYSVLGVPHAALFGALTGILAIIPFGAPVVFAVASLTLVATGGMVDAVSLLVFGSVIVFVADHFIRPVLIGGAVRLPFLWVLLGILGGLESLGLIGLFLGPAVMAVLIALWREWTAEPTPEP
jgi:predicted PurR-regulated permease PerM